MSHCECYECKQGFQHGVITEEHCGNGGNAISGPQAGPPEPIVAVSGTLFSTMASEVKDCEDETLQTAFKKLRVDAERCVRKTSRGAKELLSSGHASPVFGAAGYEPARPPAPGRGRLPPRSSSDPCPMTTRGPRRARRARGPETAPPPPTERQAAAAAAAATRTSSRCPGCRRASRGACACAGGPEQCQCRGWQGVEVYSFTGLRDVISECERNLVAPRRPVPGLGPPADSGDRRRHRGARRDPAPSRPAPTWMTSQ
ncbi:hypothetical protein SKAU_G00151100 [Synaphobranchus kaupii]|uniref:Oxidative stress-responsive serine-rich protein 1 n=1 Tax=Synaphobranchus kaupii TaxID=118154 RepID=A0A9Q1FGP2_SYNKA|nr:hypothetical protein SKAU_G00151100 [Synaphobranchus kaupii]